MNEHHLRLSHRVLKLQVDINSNQNLFEPPNWQAKATENLYKEELKLRKEQEEAVEKANEKLNNMKSQTDKVNEELRLALDQNSSLENQIASTELMVKELKQKIIFALTLIEKLTLTEVKFGFKFFLTSESGFSFKFM